MDRNIKIAKQLVKLAKSLVAVKSPLDDDYSYLDELEEKDRSQDQYALPNDTEAQKEEKIKAVDDVCQEAVQKVNGLVIESAASYDNMVKNAVATLSYNKEFRKNSRSIREVDLTIEVCSSSLYGWNGEFDVNFTDHNDSAMSDYDNVMGVSKDEVISEIKAYVNEKNKEARAKLRNDY